VDLAVDSLVCEVWGECEVVGSAHVFLSPGLVHVNSAILVFGPLDPHLRS
jgi:hypothetical protein